MTIICRSKKTLLLFIRQIAVTNCFTVFFDKRKADILCDRQKDMKTNRKYKNTGKIVVKTNFFYNIDSRVSQVEKMEEWANKMFEFRPKKCSTETTLTKVFNCKCPNENCSTGITFDKVRRRRRRLVKAVSTTLFE